MESPRMVAQRQRMASNFGPALAGGRPTVQLAPMPPAASSESAKGPRTEREGEALEQEVLAMLDRAEDAPPTVQGAGTHYGVLHYTGAAATGKPPKAPPPRSPESPEDR